MQLKKLIRFSSWWNYKIPPILCFVYIFLVINNITFQIALINISLLFLWIFGTGGIGHIINDIADIDSDRIAGKENYISFISVGKRYLLIILLLFLSFAPWCYLPVNAFLIVLIILEFVLFALYSFKPIRLKENPFGGILADALYGHAIPVLISAITFYLLSNKVKVSAYFFIFIFFWQIAKGLRNILLHQMDDLENDIKSNTRTFVVKYGQPKTLKFINRILLPAELILCFCVLGLISMHLKYFYLIFLFFLILITLRTNLWMIFTKPKNQWQEVYLFFLNDFYEEWMPLFPLAYLISMSNIYWLILIFHLLLFRPIVTKLSQDFKRLGRNISRLI